MRQAVGGTDDILAQAVGEFIDRLVPALSALPRLNDVEPAVLRLDLLAEARRLAAGFMCADERLGDRELLAFRRSFGLASPTRDDLCTLAPDDIPPVGQSS